MRSAGNQYPRQEDAPQPQLTDIKYEDTAWPSTAYTGEGAVVDIVVEGRACGHTGAPSAIVMHGRSGIKYYAMPAHHGVGLVLTDTNPEIPDPNKRMRYTVLGGRFPRRITLGQSINFPDVPEDQQIQEPITGIDIPRLNGLRATDSQPASMPGMDPLELYSAKFDQATEAAIALGMIAATRTHELPD